MTIKRFEDHIPEIHPTAYVDDMAYVSGQTTLAENYVGLPYEIKHLSEFQQAS